MARLVILALVVAGLSAGSASIAERSFAALRTVAPNVRGIVTRGPITPVCREGVPCDEPAAGVALVVTRGAVRVASVRTDAAGRFALRLAPGRYVVRLARRPAIGGFAPVTFTVRAARVVRLRLSIDTGIR